MKEIITASIKEFLEKQGFIELIASHSGYLTTNIYYRAKSLGWGMFINWEEDGVDYDCKEQKIDQDLFIPPSDVVFEDMGAMMEASMEMEQSLDKLGEQFGSGEEVDMEEMQKMI